MKAASKPFGTRGVLLLLLATLWSYLRGRTVQTYNAMVQRLSNVFASGLPAAERFDRVIGHSADHVDVGADATLAALETYLRRQGLVCPVVPFGHGRTVGQALRGNAAGRGSAAFGMLHDTALEADVLCGSGAVVRCSPQANRQLWESLPGSGEAFGRVLRVRLPVAPRPSAVAVHLMRAGSFEEASRVAADMVERHGSEVRDAEIVVSGPEEATLMVSEATEDEGAPQMSLEEAFSRASEAAFEAGSRTVSARVPYGEWCAGRPRGTVSTLVPRTQLGRAHKTEAAGLPRWYAFVAAPRAKWAFAPNAASFACWFESGDPDALARHCVALGGRPVEPAWAGDSAEQAYGFQNSEGA